MEDTLILIKPDGVQRALVGEIIARFERKGLKLRALKFMKMDRALAERHYGIHRDKPFFEDLVSFITSGPLVAMVLSGPGAIGLARRVVGATRVQDARPGTIRGDFATITTMNLIHASDAPDTARQEIGNFFDESELVDYETSLGPWTGR